MNKGTILVIDDEPDLLELVEFNLKKDGYEVIVAKNGQSGLEIAQKHVPDLIVLDLMMPGIDGLEVCRQLRGDSRTKQIPMIMLTAKSAEADRIVGLELGADDYITKPFSPRELVARVRALLRRAASTQEAPTVIRQGEVLIDLTRHEVTSSGRQVTLTPTEFRILHFIAARPGRVLSRDQIIDAAVGNEMAVFDRTIDVHIAAIRRKLGKAGDRIETIRGFGYKWREGDEASTKG
ncbi:MAG TPA: response regulator transcription factor [Tepidisphaeraceae bacterium]|nr:response regulator transcription factor [Tepidisphaeraceae bacterium]